MRLRFLFLGFVLCAIAHFVLNLPSVEGFLDPELKYNLSSEYTTGVENTISQQLPLNLNIESLTISFDFMITGYGLNQNIFQTSDKNNGIRLEFFKPDAAAWAVQSPDGNWINGIISTAPLRSNVTYNLSIEYADGGITTTLDGIVLSKKKISHVPKFDNLIFGTGYSPDRYFHGSISNISILIQEKKIGPKAIQKIVTVIMAIIFVLLLYRVFIYFQKPDCIVRHFLLKYKRFVFMIFIIVILAILCFYKLDYFYYNAVTFTAVGHAYATEGNRDHIYEPLYSTLKSIDIGDALILLGDVVEHAKQETAYRNIYNQYATLGYDIYVTPGNHDIQDAEDRKRFLEYTRQKNTDYSFVKGNVLFICLDNCGYVGVPKTQWYTPISEERIAWLKETISREGKRDAIILYTHHIIWYEKFQDDNDYAHFLKSTTMNKLLKNNVFWKKIFPLLEKSEKPVLVLGGDIGNWSETAYMVKKFKNTTFLTTGVGRGGRESDNIAQISVYKNIFTSRIKFDLLRIFLKDYYDYDEL